MGPTATGSEQDEDGIARSTGESVVRYGLWIGAALNSLAVILFFGLELDRHHSSPPTSIAATIPGLFLILSYVPGMRAIHARRFWAAASFATLSFLLTIVIGVVYIVTLAAMCPELSGCRQRAASLYMVTSAQFLLIMAMLIALGAAFTAVGVGLTHRDPWR